jgi:hypothetical protein
VTSIHFFFRLRIPQDLQAYLGKKELRYILRTGYISEAKDKGRAVAVYVQLIFKLMRKGNPEIMKLTDTQINEMIKTHYKRLIDEYDKPAPPIEVLLSQGIIAPSDIPSYLSDIEDVKKIKFKYRSL